MIMKVHTHRPHIPEPIAEELLIDELATPEKVSHEKTGFVHPTHSDHPTKRTVEQVAAQAMTETIERSRNRTNKNDLKNRHKSHEAIRFSHVEQISALLEDASYPNQNQTNARIRDLLEKESSEGDLLKGILDEVEGDQATAYSSLVMMSVEIDITENPSLFSRIQQAISILEEKHSAEILAGLNTVKVIAAFSTDPKQKKLLRSIYYEGVVGQQSPDSIIDLLLSKFGVDGFVPALRTLQRALADDIAGLASSIPPVALWRLIGGLNDASTINHAINEVSGFITRIGQSFDHVTMTRDEMARTLLMMCRNGFESNAILALGMNAVGESSQRKPFFFNLLLNLIQKFPETVWGNEGEHRERAITLLRGLNTELANLERKQRGSDF